MRVVSVDGRRNGVAGLRMLQLLLRHGSVIAGQAQRLRRLQAGLAEGQCRFGAQRRLGAMQRRVVLVADGVVRRR